MAGKTSSVRFRSKFSRYRWKGVQFEGNIATVTDPKTIDAMKSDPYYGEGLDFWEDADVALVAPSSDGDDDKSSDGDPNPADPETKPNGKSGTGKGRGTKGK